MEKFLDLAEIDHSLTNKKHELEEIFETKIEKIVVSILSEEDFYKLAQPEWTVGFAYPQKNIIFIIEQKNSGRSYDEWLKLIVHEMVHLFYFKKFKCSEPVWFFEGIACYLSGQKKQSKNIKLKDLIKYFSDHDKDIYPIAYSIMEKILSD